MRPPSALTIGAASELVRNDEFAFLYAKPGPLPPLSPVVRRNTRLGLHHGPGSFVNLSDQPRRDFNSRGFFRICRVPRVRRVIRVIRVQRVIYTVPHIMDTWFCEMDRDVPDLWTPIKGDVPK